MLTDCCVNLLNGQFRIDIENVFDRAQRAGVSRLILTGTDIETSRSLIKWLSPGERYSTAGVHPHQAGETKPGWLEELYELARVVGVCAIGETGLDFNRNFSSRKSQLICFEQQISLAMELNKPLFVHDRDSAGVVASTLEKAGQLPDVLIHCFTGTHAELETYLDAGYYIGITGWVTDRRRGSSLRELVPLIPLERLLIETDAPFLRPHNVPESWLANNTVSTRHKHRCEPAHLSFVLQAVADIREESLESLAQATFANAGRLFKLD